MQTDLGQRQVVSVIVRRVLRDSVFGYFAPAVAVWNLLCGKRLVWPETVDSKTATQVTVLMAVLIMVLFIATLLGFKA